MATILNFDDYKHDRTLENDQPQDEGPFDPTLAAKAQQALLGFIDAELQRLYTQRVVLGVARSAYSDALKLTLKATFSQTESAQAQQPMCGYSRFVPNQEKNN